MNCSLPVIVLGAGGHAKVVINALLACNRRIIGVADPARNEGEDILGVKVIGDDSVVLSFSPKNIELVNGIGALPGRETRWDIANHFRQQNYRFARVIHPTSTIGKEVVLEQGTQIMAGVVIQPGCFIGEDSIINTGVVVEHDTIVGKRCHLAPGVVLNGGVWLGNQVFIGSSSSVIQSVSIHDSSIIGAGSIIYRDIPANTKIIQKRVTIDGGTQ